MWLKRQEISARCTTCMGRLVTWTRPFSVLHLGCLLTVSSTTTPCQWHDSCPPFLNPEIMPKSREDFIHPFSAWSIHSSPTPNPRQNRQSNAKINSPRMPLHSYPTLCCPNPPGLGGKVLLLQFLVNQLRSASPVLVPDLKGRGQIKCHPGQPNGRCIACTPPTIHLCCN